MEVWAAIHHGPNSSGMARHLAPFWCRQRIALTVRRRLLGGGTFAGGRHASTSGSSTAHCSFVSSNFALRKGSATPPEAARSGSGVNRT
jgi:hypothetical protein